MEVQTTNLSHSYVIGCKYVEIEHVFDKFSKIIYVILQKNTLFQLFIAVSGDKSKEP